MPGYRGFADYFPNINKVEAKLVALRLAFKGNPKLLENKIANRILYSGAVAISTQDFMFDLAILFEALRLDGDIYFKKTLKTIYIPESLLYNFPDLAKLVQIFIDAVSAPGFTLLVFKTHLGEEKKLGTLIKPKMLGPQDLFAVKFEDKKYQIPQNRLMFVQAPPGKIQVSFWIENNNGQVGAKQQVFAISGQLGLIVDTRC